MPGETLPDREGAADIKAPVVTDADRAQREEREDVPVTAEQAVDPNWPNNPESDLAGAPEGANTARTDAVDTSAPDFAINKLRGRSGVTTDSGGYGRGRDEYPHNDLEPSAAKSTREAAWREREGLPPRTTSFEPAKPEKTGILSRIAARLRGGGR